MIIQVKNVAIATDKILKVCMENGILSMPSYSVAEFPSHYLIDIHDSFINNLGIEKESVIAGFNAIG